MVEARRASLVGIIFAVTCSVFLILFSLYSFIINPGMFSSRYRYVEKQFDALRISIDDAMRGEIGYINQAFGAYDFPELIQEGLIKSEAPAALNRQLIEETRTHQYLLSISAYLPSGQSVYSTDTNASFVEPLSQRAWFDSIIDDTDQNLWVAPNAGRTIDIVRTVENNSGAAVGYAVFTYEAAVILPPESAAGELQLQPELLLLRDAIVFSTTAIDTWDIDSSILEEMAFETFVSARANRDTVTSPGLYDIEDAGALSLIAAPIERYNMTVGLLVPHVPVIREILRAVLILLLIICLVLSIVILAMSGRTLETEALDADEADDSGLYTADAERALETYESAPENTQTVSTPEPDFDHEPKFVDTEQSGAFATTVRHASQTERTEWGTEPEGSESVEHAEDVVPDTIDEIPLDDFPSVDEAESKAIAQEQPEDKAAQAVFDEFTTGTDMTVVEGDELEELENDYFSSTEAFATDTLDRDFLGDGDSGSAEPADVAEPTDAVDEDEAVGTDEDIEEPDAAEDTSAPENEIEPEPSAETDVEDSQTPETPVLAGNVRDEPIPWDILEDHLIDHDVAVNAPLAIDDTIDEEPAVDDTPIAADTSDDEVAPADEATIPDKDRALFDKIGYAVDTIETVEFDERLFQEEVHIENLAEDAAADNEDDEAEAELEEVPQIPDEYYDAQKPVKRPALKDLIDTVTEGELGVLQLWRNLIKGFSATKLVNSTFPDIEALLENSYNIKMTKALYIEWNDEENAFTAKEALNIAEKTNREFRLTQDEDLFQNVLSRKKLLFIKSQPFASEAIAVKFHEQEKEDTKRMLFMPILNEHDDIRAFLILLKISAQETT